MNKAIGSRLVDAYALATALDVQPATIRQWAARGHITRRGTSPQGLALYNVVEVVQHAATRRKQVA